MPIDNDAHPGGAVGPSIDKDGIEEPIPEGLLISWLNSQDRNKSDRALKILQKTIPGLKRITDSEVSGYSLPVSSIRADPHRFAYKIQNEVTWALGIDPSTGESGSLAGLIRWVPAFSQGPLFVWFDPGDGQVYVVDGHNRLAKAVELSVSHLEVFFIKAKDAQAARFFGARHNIGRGHGTALDAASFFREVGIDKQFLDEEGMQARYPFVVKALSLSRLPECWFQAVLENPHEDAGMLNLALAVGESDLTAAQAELAFRELMVAIQTRGIDPVYLEHSFWRLFLALILSAKKAPREDGVLRALVHEGFTLWEQVELIQECQWR